MGEEWPTKRQCDEKAETERHHGDRRSSILRRRTRHLSPAPQELEQANQRWDLVMNVAIGLKARTGRAVLVAVAGDVRKPQLIERSQIQLLPDGAWAPYHAAAGLDPADARESVRRSIASAHRLATSGIREAARRVAEAGHEPCGCAVLVGTGMPDWSTDEILAVHVRMHKAEGELFRDVLVAGVRACDLALTTLPDKSALEDASKRLGLTRARLDAHLAALGKVSRAALGQRPEGSGGGCTRGAPACRGPRDPLKAQTCICS